MSIWIQHILVLSLVVACFAFVLRQAIGTLRGAKSRLGSCCAKGCASAATPQPHPKAAALKPTVYFLPVERLYRRR